MKRFLDILLIVLLAIVWIPLCILLVLMCRVFNRSSVFFKQMRSGQSGKPFVLYKFRTMSDEYDKNGKLLFEDERLTKFGQFLRKTSLDELPELWNVLKGDMSLVGPRPLLMEYLDRYTKEQARRHEMKPGITGWAQINGRNAINWEEKFILDLWYIDNWSFSLDIKILIKTIFKTIIREGINQPGNATMEEFKGVIKD